MHNNILSEINTDMLAISLVLIILFTLLTAALAVAAVFIIGKYHTVADEDTVKVGNSKRFICSPSYASSGLP